MALSRSLPFLVLTAVIVHSTAAPARHQHTCIHGSRQDKLITGVAMQGGDHVKRLSRQPIRFSMFRDPSITNDLPDTKREMITEEVMPALVQFLSTTLSVIPLTQPILLDNWCSAEGYYSTGRGRECVDVCEPTMCGTVRVPDQHLKACLQCQHQQPPNCLPGTPADDGEGVADSDFILYISAIQSECPQGSDTTVIAFAGACQMESSQDRPIAGYINFCPSAIEEGNNAFVFSVAKHELLHALAFSSQLFPYWRDQTGAPRTPRSDSTDPLQASTSTVRTLTYPSWRTAMGPVQHTVTALVTEAVVREGRAHFGYPDLEGVELENQGGEGTQFQHWEKRILGNEAMTGVFTFDPVFSRLSLAVMEDSGWYSVDYSAANILLWGRGKGRSFVEEGCGNLVMDTETENNPFCGVHQELGCTLGRGAVAQCNRVSFTRELDQDFQYFEGSPQDGGSLQVTDFCPIYRAFTYQSGQGTNCSDPNNQLPPQEDVRGEKYGERSRCVEQGRKWQTVSGSTIYSSSLYGGGCYEYECSTDDVTIYVRGVPFKCSCEGEEHIVDISSGSDCVMGSIICPSCASICYDQLDNCPTTEPAPCYGRVVEAERECANIVSSGDPTNQGHTPLQSSITLWVITILSVLL